MSPPQVRLLGSFEQSHNNKSIEVHDEHVIFEGEKYTLTWIENHSFYFFWGDSYWYYIRNGESYEVIKYHKNDGYHTLKAKKDGKYRAKGWTVNSSDGNRTELVNMTVNFNDGTISGLGWYGAGTSYNESLSSKWQGTFNYQNAQVEWNEIYGNQTEFPFIYRGERKGNVITGTYNWTKNAAVGTFQFTLTPDD